MSEQINAFSWNAHIDLTTLSINLVIAFILGLILRWHFKKFGSLLSNRDELGQILPIISLTIVLIISIVKSSLALSLGLVGALSIVRFRTPIKEPEELAYLFIAIAVGLGLGANQREAVILSFVLITVFVTIIKYQKKSIKDRNMFLTISISKASLLLDDNIKTIGNILSKYTTLYNLRRADTQENLAEFDYIIDLKSPENIDALNRNLREVYQDVNITFLDQNNIPRL